VSLGWTVVAFQYQKKAIRCRWGDFAVKQEQGVGRRLTTGVQEEEEEEVIPERGSPTVLRTFLRTRRKPEREREGGT
jgi:hypothetical protein